MRSLLAGLLLIVACGGRTSAPPPIARASAPPADAPVPNPSGPTESECDELFAHALALALAERQPPPSESDAATLRGELRPGFVADCRAGTRAYHACGLAAKSRADLDACKR